MRDDAVNPADWEEQHQPPDPDPLARAEEQIDRDEPEADVLEQDLPVGEPDVESPVSDADRVEPVDADEGDWEAQHEER